MTEAILNDEQRKLVMENHNLIYPIIKTIHCEKDKSIEKEDLEQMALLHLCKAAATFDASKGYSFSTYATTVIKNQLYKDFRDINRHNITDTISFSISRPDEDDAGWSIYNLPDLSATYDNFETNHTLRQLLLKWEKSENEEEKLCVKIAVGLMKGTPKMKLHKDLGISYRHYTKCLSQIKDEIKEFA